VISGTAAANQPSCRLLLRLGMRVTGHGTGSFRKTADGEANRIRGPIVRHFERRMVGIALRQSATPRVTRRTGVRSAPARDRFV
jgi:hypothetical protein